MKKTFRLTALGLVLTLLLGILAACGTPAADRTPSPAVTPTDTVTTPEPTPTPTPSPTPEPEPSPEPTPEPTEPPYDPFSDPNVLWTEAPFDYDGASVTKLQWLIEEAGEENLIVFCVESYASASEPFQLDIDRLFIPPEIDGDGKLKKMMQQYCAMPAGDERTRFYWDEINMYLRKITGDLPEEYYDLSESHGLRFNTGFLASALNAEQEGILNRAANKLMDEWGVNRSPGNQEERAVYDEYWKQAIEIVEEQLRTDPWYQEVIALREHYAYVSMLVTLFKSSWKRQEAEYARQRFIELGFTPLYDLRELTDLTRWTTRLAALAFLGTPEQLRQIEDLLDEDESATLGAYYKYFLEHERYYEYMYMK